MSLRIFLADDNLTSFGCCEPVPVWQNHIESSRSQMESAVNALFMRYAKRDLAAARRFLERSTRHRRNTQLKHECTQTQRQ